jgi:Zn-dependent protease
VAYLLGDPTAKDKGRLTLNPLKHLDLMGTVVFLVTRMIGWAKPVPVDPSYFKNPKQGMMLVGLAGPAANLVVAGVCSIFFHHLNSISALFSSPLAKMILVPLAVMTHYCILINVGLAFFNIIPIPPLDGSKILYGLLPQNLAFKYSKVEPYGFAIIIFLLMTGIINKTIIPFIRLVVGWLI